MRQPKHPESLKNHNPDMTNPQTAADLKNEYLAALDVGMTKPAMPVGCILLKKIPDDNWASCYATIGAK